jgi:hypothetical protein
MHEDMSCVSGLPRGSRGRDGRCGVTSRREPEECGEAVVVVVRGGVERDGNLK